ncbi:response regulator transcription factor [Dechloromonas denitrificans]|uniref:response regulator transcription factor n=1 Tax=Dechloromonas denitrificans TaxID=281362 RepID=UPI001CF88D87|nr:response regulator [Dechloromonas denitrificans]UCV05375.1 response regulator [Dechloromonas denitrificans]UCV09720.1 response regulator [Dechloromonas denitrificans]
MSEMTLVIDDDPSFNAILIRTLERRGHPACGALDVGSARELARQTGAGQVVLDLNLNGSSGLALIPELLAINPDCRIVVLTGYASIATAVDAVKLGAVQYLAKPVEIEAILAAFEDSDGPDLDLPASDEPLSVDRLEWEHIQRVLNENDGNISATARALKMHRRTLQRKLSKRPVRT